MIKNFSTEKYDILVQAGQSNSEGHSFGYVDSPYIPNDSVWYMNGDFTITCATENVRGNEIESNFALSFARKYLEHGLLKGGRKLLILRTAVGGTGFLDNRWNKTGDLYLRMMEMIKVALELNKENRIVCFLWHQGETDAMLKTTYDKHYKHLVDLLYSVRSEFGVSKLPFIAGDFVHHWKNENIEISTPVVEAIRAVCQNSDYSRFVETDDLKSNFQELHRTTLSWEDNIHFSRKSIYILGERYFDMYYEIINK